MKTSNTMQHYTPGNENYAGTLSALTKYGTLNISASRIAKPKHPNKRDPRLTDGIAHPCVCTRADGSQYIIVRKPNRTTARKPRNTIVEVKQPEAATIKTDPRFVHNFND